MSDKHSRFLNLERERKDGPVASTGQADRARFGGIAQPGAPLAPAPAPIQAPPGPSADRFRDPLEASQGLELAERRPEDQPFVRCARCEADNHALATYCSQCHSLFDTEEQRAYNERLWRERREQAATEAEQQARFASERALAESQGADARRAAAAAMAAQVAASTRARLDAEERASWGATGLGTPWRRPDPVLMLLGRLSPRATQILLLTGGALLLLLLAFKRTRGLGLGVGFFLAVLYLRALVRR